MAEVIVGKVLEPEVQEYNVKGEWKMKQTFGLLSGKTSTLFSVWQGDRCFDAVDKLNDGDLVIAIVAHGVKDGKLVTYLNRIAPCSDDLPMLLNSFFAVKRSDKEENHERSTDGKGSAAASPAGGAGTAEKRS